MSSTAIDILRDGQLFTDVFTKPAIDAIRTEMQGHVKQVTDALSIVRTYDGRLMKLERDQKKALLGWSIYATAAAGLFTYGWSTIRSWLGGHFRA